MVCIVSLPIGGESRNVAPVSADKYKIPRLRGILGCSTKKHIVHKFESNILCWFYKKGSRTPIKQGVRLPFSHSSFIL